ncbi:hypothetical protein ACFVWG_23260 [Kribbella sp. NPDC058245]|uniref:hypothetical protein n=1 Tax=Kribbella sp. NPDC058245 TaxID=3346399 RepID=UPI0036EE9AC2
MEILAMAPVWSQSGSELLTNLDNLYAAKSLIDTYILQTTRRLDEMSTAQELGARDTVELVAQRYRLNPADVRKDLKVSGALGKYPAVKPPSHPAFNRPQTSSTTANVSGRGRVGGGEVGGGWSSSG